MTPLNYEQNGYGQPDPTAEDLGLTPLADDPEWLDGWLDAPIRMTDAQQARLAELRQRHPEKRGWQTPQLQSNSVTNFGKVNWFSGRNPADGLAELQRVEGWGVRLTLEWRPESFTMPGRQRVTGYGRTVREAYHDAWREQRLWKYDKDKLLRRVNELVRDTQRKLYRAEIDYRELAEQVKDWQARAALEDEAVRQRDVARAAAQEAYNTVARLESAVESQGEVITDLREGLELVRNTLRDCGYTSGALHKRIQEMHAELVQLRKASAQSGATSHRSQPPKPAA